MTKVKGFLALILSVLSVLVVTAQPPTVRRTYTKERPLVYEDVRDLWPYAFLNEKGQPDGFNVDLVRMLLDELKIPYIIKMSNTMDAFNDLKAGRSDLIMGLSTGFHDAYGHYSTNSVTLFTQSIVSPKRKPSTIRNLRDLATHQVIVNDSSLTHHLMIDYGWGHNAIPTKDVGATLLKMSTEEEGEMVWNTLSLKWLLNKYQIDNLELQPVNMPHGEYKFMSNDDVLLAKLDSMLTVLSSSDRLTPLNNKWFYPNRQQEELPRWLWYVAAGIGILMLILLIYAVSYRVQARRITAENNKRNRRLALILETAGVRVWTYDISSQQFTWRNEFGQPAYVYSRDEFAQRYSPEDFTRLDEAMRHLSSLVLKKDEEEEEITLNIKAQDAREDGDTEMHEFVITLSVLRRDKRGTPTVLIGTKKDVTKKAEQEREDHERTLRYWALFNTPIVGIMFFDRDGHLANINQKACEMFGCDREEMMTERPSFNQLFDIDMSLEETDGFHATQTCYFDKVPLRERKVRAVRRTEKMFNEYRMMTVDDETGQLLGMFAFCTDVTYVVHSLEEQARCEAELLAGRAKLQEYVKAIDDFIRNSRIRIVSYSPVSHMFTIYKNSSEVQHALTPIRLMTLVDSRIRIKAMHLINKMDNRERSTIDTDIRTTLRPSSGHTLHVHLHLIPQLDQNGEIREYFGSMRDISELKATEQQLAQVEAKTQEVEDTKTTFTRNMMQEIRRPMAAVIEKAGRLTTDSNTPEQVAIRSDIVGNAQQLTHVIDNVLYLSRLEANMVEIVKQPTDFAQLFEEHCSLGWGKEVADGSVRCMAENPYDQLVIDIDAEHLGNVIQQLTRNAAQHTRRGLIHTRYDYIGRRLIISIDDTGEGIDQHILRVLNSEFESGVHTSMGMGLAICKELLRQMGGHLEINSEVGLGTTVWITLPCQATVVKRKKNL